MDKLPTEIVQEIIISYLDTCDLRSFRVVRYSFASLAASQIFKTIKIEPLLSSLNSLLELSRRPDLARHITKSFSAAGAHHKSHYGGNSVCITQIPEFPDLTRICRDSIVGIQELSKAREELHWGLIWG